MTDENDARYRLDPSKLPRKLDLEVSEEMLQHLESISARTGRSISEIVGELLGRALGDHIPEA